MGCSMSITHTFEYGWIISHEKYINEIYGPKYIFKNLFRVLTPFRMDQEAKRLALNRPSKQKGQKRPSQNVIETPEIVQKTIDLLASDLRTQFASLPTDPKVIADNNQQVRDLVVSLESNEIFHDLHLYENTAGTVSICGENLLPPKSAYCRTDIRYIESVLQGRHFDVVLLDPPWENKHIKRSKSYISMSNKDIFDSIDINKLLSPIGVCIIWCTSSKRHQSEAIKWIKDSGLYLLTTYYWLKVTCSGELVHSVKKKPSYELVFIASKLLKKIESRVIISIPSSVHSHKPPLTQILKDSDLPWTNGLEIFGRYCLPNWTTIGNQALKLQNIRYYNEN
ncbi:N(6)-adenine-specific methyltransferase METTL4 [Lepeophtheirus salmonis]|uniref:N(6)-adenine-specific methyltransferase METTL4 n=1 Tax=Lepeophtheirus salmonis TaxID=72036 RepID=UPI001AE30C8A|nr:N(6)-adenine-specific methyltransferase METTL4-like [Lepeophtheirus salmonis]